MNQQQSVRQKIAEVLELDEQGVDDAMVLTDLVSSSFRLVELIIELQEEFDVRFQQSDMHDVTTVGQLVQLVNSRTIHATSG
jgi:acyl carrier protein